MRITARTLALNASMLIAGLLIGTLVLAPTLLANQGTAQQPFPQDSAWRNQAIRVVGSTTVLPIANACAIRFMELYNTTSITVEGGGSGRGYSELIDGASHQDVGHGHKERRDARKERCCNDGALVSQKPGKHVAGCACCLGIVLSQCYRPPFHR